VADRAACEGEVGIGEERNDADAVHAVDVRDNLEVKSQRSVPTSIVHRWLLPYTLHGQIPVLIEESLISDGK
jgi:hypothetical protein